MKYKIKKFCLSMGVGMVILLGIFLRTYKLNQSPASMNFDEAALGYNAYSLMKTGKDEFGYKFPITLRSFNDYKPALYAYFSIPFIKAWGLNEFSVRLVSALSGTVSLFFLYLFLNKFNKNKNWSVLVFLILSISPWRLHYSRNAFESNLSCLFFTAGAWFLYKARFKNRWKNLLLAVSIFSISAYSYHSARLAAPLLLIFSISDLLVFIYKKNLIQEINKFVVKRSKYIASIFIFVGLCLPIFLMNSGKLVLTRFRIENVFNRYYPYTPKEIMASDNPWLEWRAHPVYYLGGLLSGHIFSYISPINLSSRVFHWIKGSSQYISTLGMFDLVGGLVFIFGLYKLIINIKKHFKYRFLVYWIIAGAAPAAVTWNWYHPLRSLNIFPALDLIIAAGFYEVFLLLKKKFDNKLYFGVISAFLMVFLSVNLVYTINNEFNYNVWENHGEYQPGGFKEGVPILKDYQDKYDQIIIESPHAQSYIFFLFYQSFPPELLQSFSNYRPEPDAIGNLDFDFYKYKFRKIDWPKDKMMSKTIFWKQEPLKDYELKEFPNLRQIVLKNALNVDTAAIIFKD